MQSLTISADLVSNIFLNELVIAKSKDLVCLLLTGQASSPYISDGKHLVLTSCTTTSGEAIRPTLPNVELNDL
jgi:hypothetical protein